MRVSELSCRTARFELLAVGLYCYLSVEVASLLSQLSKRPPDIAALCGTVWGRHPFGFILASLVTQVAVEDVHSGQRATRGSANVGGF